MTGDMESRAGKNPGREGGPLGWLHTERGIVPIGDDGFPLIDDDHPELDSAAHRDLAALEEAGLIATVVDTEPLSVVDIEYGPRGGRGSRPALDCRPEDRNATEPI